MVLNHLAAMVFFGGPLFYVGLWIAIDPAACTGIVERLGARAEISRKVRTGVRFAGVALVLLAMAI